MAVLLLLNGVVYIPFASHGDDGPWHGWVLSYNASTLKQISAYCTTPNGTGAGIWMSGTGLSAEVVDPVNKPYGRMFFATGNGDFTATKPYKTTVDYGNTIMNMDLTNGVLSVSDEFTPWNQHYLDESDGDLGSGGVVLLPNNLLVQTGKQAVIYLVNRNSMGGYSGGTTDSVVQELANGSTGNGNSNANWGAGLWGSPAYWNNNVYVGGSGVYGSSGAPLKAFSLSSGSLSSSPTSISAQVFAYPGPTPAVSSNGASNGILWAVQNGGYSSGKAAVIWAYDATNLANVLWNSSINTGDNPGLAIKYAIPVVANGKLYVAESAPTDRTLGQLNVYGLLTTPTAATPVISPGSQSFASSFQASISDTTQNATIYYTTDGSMPTISSQVYNGPITVSTTETITAIASAAGYLQSDPASASYALQTQTATPLLSLAAGAYTGSQTLSITDGTPGAVIYYTTDGSTPNTSSTQYSGSIQVVTSETVSAMALAPNYLQSNVVSAAYTIQAPLTIDFSQGFASAAGQMQFNGNTGLDDSRLALTDGNLYETSSAFYNVPVNVQQFTTDFIFQLSNPVGEGITFTIQNQKATALGGVYSGLGYSGIPKSMAIKFDLKDNSGEGPDSTGIYINGAAPTVPATDLSSTGINLHSGDTMHVHITYDGANFNVTITDTVTNATWTKNFSVNIPALVGGSTAYVGFTGSTGTNNAASQKIATWTYVVGPPSTQGGGGTGGGATVPNYPAGTGFTSTGLTFNGGANVSGTNLSILDGGSNETRTAYFSTPVNVLTFTTDFDFQITKPVGGGFTFIVQNAGLNAVGASGGSGLGSHNMPMSVAVKFDIYNNAGEGNDSTGVYLNGAYPTVPATNITSSGIELNSGHILHAHIVYDGTNLNLVITDPTTNDTFMQAYPVNIPQTVGNTSAYVGFTAASGSGSAVINILDWTYTTQ